MTEREPAEDGVHRLVLAGLRDLDELRGAAWAQYVEHLCTALLNLDADVRRTLAQVIRASAVVQ